MSDHFSRCLAAAHDHTYFKGVGASAVGMRHVATVLVGCLLG